MAIANFPILNMSLEEFQKLQIPGPDIDLRTVEMGYTFRCKPTTTTNEIVVGQIVKGDDLFCDQWGSGLAVPARGSTDIGSDYKAVKKI